jgi:hypothetical protein
MKIEGDKKMPSILRHSLFISITVIAMALAQAECGEGSVGIQYFYDEVGNRVEIRTGIDTTAPTTTASPGGGIYYTAQSVTLTCNDGTGLGCDKIYYTTNGTTPTTSSPVYSAPVNISVNTTLKYFGSDLAGNNENVQTQTYTIVLDTTPPTTSASPLGGAYNTAQSVILSCSDGTGSGCDKIYYTIDGTTPTTSSPVYSSAVNITITTTLKYFARDLAGNSETVKTQIYTIDTIAPTTAASPPGGTYSTVQSVTLSCTDSGDSGCDRIYYTTDGTTPTTSSPVYSSPIIISVTTTLKFFAKDLAGNSEAVKTEIYTISMGPVMIGSNSYSSIQAAYDAAVNGNVIKCRDLTFIEDLIVYRNVSVTLEGGYDSTFTTNYGTMTTLRGMITTTVGGGTLTIENFTLTQ